MKICQMKINVSLRYKNREDPNCLIFFFSSRSGFKNANKMKQMRRLADYISDNA